MTLLDVAAADRGIARQVVDVELDRRGARALQVARVVRPAARRDAVQARDHGNLHRRDRALEQAEIPTRPRIVAGLRREVRERLGEALAAEVGEVRVGRRLSADLLLEQRIEDDRSDARRCEAAHAVDGV
jgi:hypothetical protein